MRGSDLIGLALSGFRQSKTRTGLTLAGVLLGTTMFAVSVSLGHGLRQYTYESFHKDDGLRTIFARDGFRSPSVDESAIPTAEIALPDTVGPARRQRLRKHLVRRWQERQPS